MSELYEDIYTEKFSFGKNWAHYLKRLTKRKLQIAQQSIQHFTKLKTLTGKTFIDVGCGSGLFSLAAIMLGAKHVTSFDADINSVNCALYLRKKFKIPHTRWRIEHASAVNAQQLKKFKKADIVYSWGVLHHTGDMWKALDLVTTLVEKNGLLYIAIYNHYTRFPSSHTWLKIKKLYVNSPAPVKWLITFAYITQILLFRMLHFQNPISYVKNYERSSVRGMSFYNDVIDWLGGYPYEFASVKEITDFYEQRGYATKNIRAVNGTGCNEFLFQKVN